MPKAVDNPTAGSASMKMLGNIKDNMMIRRILL